VEQVAEILIHPGPENKRFRQRAWRRRRAGCITFKNAANVACFSSSLGCSTTLHQFEAYVGLLYYEKVKFVKQIILYREIICLGGHQIRLIIEGDPDTQNGKF